MLRLISKSMLGHWGVPSPALQVLPRFYHERVADYYNNPRNVGSFDGNERTVGTGLVEAPACQDVLKLKIKDDENIGKILDAGSATLACNLAIDSLSAGRCAKKKFDFDEKDLSSEESLWDLYERWIDLYGFSRSHAEKCKRFKFFKAKAKLVHNVNKMNLPYKLRLIIFSDKTDDVPRRSCLRYRVAKERQT